MISSEASIVQRIQYRSLSSRFNPICYTLQNKLTITGVRLCSYASCSVCGVRLFVYRVRGHGKDGIYYESHSHGDSYR